MVLLVAQTGSFKIIAAQFLSFARPASPRLATFHLRRRVHWPSGVQCKHMTHTPRVRRQ